MQVENSCQEKILPLNYDVYANKNVNTIWAV